MTIKTRNIADSAVTAAKLASNAVTAAKLSATMQLGIIPLPLAEARQIVTDTFGVIAVGGAGTTGSGGILGSDGAATYAKLVRVNGATDKKARIQFPADANNLPIAWDIVYPPDLDDTAVVTVKFRAAMAGATDTPVVAVGYFEGLGDTNAGGNSAAVTGTTITTYSVTIAAADIGAAPNGASIEFDVATHTTDLLNLYSAWVEYTRK